MARLEIRILGSFQVALDGDPVTDFETNAARALLAYLAADPGRAWPRPVVAEMLWPDRPEGAALSNLRHVLSVLRRTLGDRRSNHRVLVTDGNSVALAPSDDLWIDMIEFEGLVDTPADAPGAADAWRRAIELWRGPLLEGLKVRAGAEWEEWLVVTGERVRRRFAVALRNLADHLERRGAWQQALHIAQRLTEIDPWDERAHRSYMRLLARSGEAARALAYFDELLQRLLDEMGMEPSPETFALADRIRSGDLVGAESKTEVTYPAFLSKGGSTPRPLFVDRQAELDQLQHHLDAALAGSGKVVFVAGEAGSGKTMLLAEFMQRVAGLPDLLIAGGRCNAFGGLGDPYLPFREVMNLLCGDIETPFTSGGLDREQATRLWEAIPHSAQLVADVSPSLIGVMLNGGLLSERIQQALPGVEWAAALRARIDGLAGRPPVAERQQPALFDEFTAMLQRLAITRPLLLVVDDLQWADQGSVALLWHLARRLAGTRVLIVGAYRPEEISRQVRDGPSLAAVLSELQALAPESLIALSNDRRFVDEFLDAEPNSLDEAFRQHLFTYTAGHPLFTVELVRGMRDRGEIRRDRAGVWDTRGSLAWDRIPSRVEAAIAQRVARLPEPLQRDLAVASVQGEEFVAEVVAEVRNDVDVPARLSHESSTPQALVRPAGVRRLDGHLTARHRFRHRLFQRYLYERMDDAERMRLHEATARALEDLYRGHADTPVVDLAQHFDQAGLTGPATDYFQEAGQRALKMSAAEEAVTLLDRARTLLLSLPSSVERDERELALLGGLFAAFMASRGYASPEAEQVGERVRELCDRLDPSPTATLALAGLASVLTMRARYVPAAETAKEAVRMSEVLGEPALEVATHKVLGYVQTWMADLAGGHANLHAAYDVYDADLHAWLMYATGSAEGPDAMVWDAVNTLHRGYPDQAYELVARAIDLARKLGHPFTLCHALALGNVVLHHMAGNFVTDDSIEEVETIATAEHFPFYEAAVRVYRGQTAGYAGDYAAGIESIMHGIEAWRAMGVEAFRGSFLADVAWFEQARGNSSVAHETIERAVRISHESGEHLGELHALVLRGRIFAVDHDPRAESLLEETMVTAARSKARFYELRAAAELASFHRRRGDTERAREVLTPVYSWFTEGFDTPYVVAAGRILEEL